MSEEPFFDEKFLQPFAPMFERTRMPRNPEALSCLALSGADDTAKDMLNQLIAVNAWGEAQKAIEFAMSNLQKSGIEMPEEITLGIFLGDPVRLAQSEGYRRWLHAGVYSDYDCAQRAKPSKTPCVYCP